MKHFFVLTFICVLCNSSYSQEVNFVINLKVVNLDTGSYKIKLTEIISASKSSVTYTDSITKEKDSVQIEGFIPEERYVYLSLTRTGSFDFGIGPGDTAYIELTREKNRIEKFKIIGSNRVVQSGNYINKIYDDHTQLLQNQSIRMDSILLAKASNKQVINSKHVYDSLYHSIFLFNVNYADTVVSAVAAAVALTRHTNDTSMHDISLYIKKSFARFGDLATLNSLLLGYKNRDISQIFNKRDSLNIYKTFKPNFQKSIVNVFKKNKLILIDFWASWCKPCIEEFPFLNSAYDKFNKKGFEIISISFDENKNAWIKAKKRFSTRWKNHLIDTQSLNSETAKLLGIKSIPRNYLIDNSGTIHGKNLRKDKLLEILAKLL